MEQARIEKTLSPDLPTGQAGGRKQGKTRILVAPLDWGLGHATRCIPLIRELLEQGCEPWLAAEGAQEHLLKTEFPELPILTLEGYRVKYARTASGLFSNILFQTPRILRAIKAENNWLKKIVEQYAIDAVISDNRYGLYHPGIPCIFITHQLRIKTPLGKWAEVLLQKRNYKFINHFSACWVPDSANPPSLAGELSHPKKLPVVPLRYIGNLSRFSLTGINSSKNHLLIILSGPEPQRTILENILVNEIAQYPGTASFVRGLPGSASFIPSTNTITFHNHLSASSLNTEIEKAEWVIGRCGYSTVMDLVKLQKKSILIPTPGQTEQEWLAKHLMSEKIAFCVKQKNFSLREALREANAFNYELPHLNTTKYLQLVISEFISEP